jgi:alpha-tubulin suppressor-like RCC1 family protein
LRTCGLSGAGILLAVRIADLFKGAWGNGIGWGLSRQPQIAAGVGDTCAIDTGGQAYSWGYNSNGQRGDGSNTDRTVPVAVHTAGTPMDGKTLTQIAGYLHTCVIDTGELAYCWG